ncbi:hypothetical protein MMU07_04410 [Aquiflexum sp. LQ15W]|uniref:hypothetical protein n=1 Tax=Cognataquiflexum nitidum TaxID=2922272 RepID=UPI001F14885A|nr:hypothetical protein [Cognataquiflexum nitidum]MCH6198806.1 hypothetical protein [Cognataquiflexum nitidum]
MKRIICDTMIWYNLAENKIPMPDPNKYTLVCTYLTLMELAFSPNNFFKLTEVQNAIKSIIKLKPHFEISYPKQYALDLISGNLDSYFSPEEDLTLGFLKILVNHPEEFLSENDFKISLEEISSQRRKNYSDWAEFLNELYDLDKKIKWALKKHLKNDFFISQFKEIFVLNLNERENGLFLSDQIDWSIFEFYIGIGGKYLRTVQLSRMKVDPNDENDLLNMIYVQPDDLYWTLEKKWLSIAKEAKLENYLYKPVLE